MSDFAPNAMAGGVFGDVIVVRKHPNGKAGANSSLREVATKVREGRNDPRLRAWAGRAIHERGGPQTVRGRAEAVLEQFHEDVSYVPDPLGTEMIQKAAWTLCLDEHGLCFKAGDCDDVIVALASAFLSVGIPTRIVAQAFDQDVVPGHVALQIETGDGWVPVDPSTKEFPVGKGHPALREWIMDPMTDVDVVGGGSMQGDFVGVGAGPRFLGASEDLGLFGRSYDLIVGGVLEDVGKLDESVNGLGAAVEQVTAVRNIVRPSNPFDPDPPGVSKVDASTISGASAGGKWTRGMDVFAVDQYLSGRQLVRAGYEAAEGKRKIFVTPDGGTYIESLPGDPWSMKAVYQIGNALVFAFFGNAGEILGGFAADSGRSVPASEIKANLGRAGAPNSGVESVSGSLGIHPVVVGIALIAGAVVAISGYLAYAKHCETTQIVAIEASNKAITDNPNLTAEQKIALSAAQGKYRVDLQDAKNRAPDFLTNPFGVSNVASEIGGVIKWVVVGGAIAAAVVFLGPGVKDAIEKWMERRKSGGHQLAPARANPLFQLRRTDVSPGRHGMYSYGPATIWLSGGGYHTWATVRFLSQEKDFEARTVDGALEKAIEWIDDAPELQRPR